MTSIAALALAALSLAACEARITDANIAVVNRQYETGEQGKGSVSPKEVESILGPPKSSASRILSLETQKKEVELVRYYYEQDGQTIELHFLDNKLISPIPKLQASKSQAPASTVQPNPAPAASNDPSAPSKNP
jgi:hypothetical protein